MFTLLFSHLQRPGHVTTQRDAAPAFDGQLRLRCSAVLIALGLLAGGCRPAPPQPNIVLIMTDDQGIGDFGLYGNPVLQTPNLDAMASRSARWGRFYVSPVCAPTRASLMTGRYNYRTRVVDTYIGRAMMEPDETTLAEVLAGAGYATGIFGKWHLGDTYPMRAMDQGFEESLVLRGGGIGQPSDPPGGEGRYTNAILSHNGTLVQTAGYCTDVYFDSALDWIERVSPERPFFAYIATNTPHSPYHDVPDSLYRVYAARDLTLDQFPHPEAARLEPGYDTDVLARIYAMVGNIDENIGRLFARLERDGLLENTIVVFLVDNGPESRRYVGAMRGRKTEVFEGGIRSPLFAHWPGHFPARTIEGAVAAHIDLFPTLLDAAGVTPPAGLRLDGRSLLPALEGAPARDDGRTLTIQSHRGDQPARYHQFASMRGRWKLVHNSGFGRERLDTEPAFELYDIEADPYESNNLAAQHPDTLDAMVARYDAWFDDVSATRPDNYAPPRIVVGHPAEPVTVLTRQDWRYPGTHGAGGWAPDALGYWLIDVAETAVYAIDVRFGAAPAAGTLTLRSGDTVFTAPIAAGEAERRLTDLPLAAGPQRFEVVLTSPGLERGPLQVEISR